MADTKILQAILDGQVSIKEGLKRLEERVEKLEVNLGGRIDNLGLQIAALEDDAPTISEFGQFEKRVDKLEKHFASA